MNNKKMRGFSIVDLLIGKTYQSPNSYKSGVINWAEKRDEIWAGENETCYLIRYRQDGHIKDQHATIFVVNN